MSKKGKKQSSVYDIANQEIENIDGNDFVISIFVPIAAVLLFKSNFIAHAIIFIIYDIICNFILNRRSQMFVARFSYDDIERLATKCYENDTYYKYGSETETLREIMKIYMNSAINELLRLDEIKIKKAEQEEVKKNGPVHLEQTSSKQKSQLQESVSKLYDFDIEESNIPHKKYQKILNDVSTLMETLEKKPKCICFVDTTFNVYVDEIISLFEAYDTKLNITKSDKDKIQELMNAFDDYVLRTIEKIQNQNQTEIDISCDVIIKNLNETNV